MRPVHFIIACHIAAVATSASAQISVDWNTIDCGGGTSTGGSFIVNGTIGQWDAESAMTGGNFTVNGGFWTGGGVQPPQCPWQQAGCAADFDNSGGVDGDDVIAFFAAWDIAEICADVDLTGSADGDDVILFFTLWDQGGC